MHHLRPGGGRPTPRTPAATPTPCANPPRWQTNAEPSARCPATGAPIPPPRSVPSAAVECGMAQPRLTPGTWLRRSKPSLTTSCGRRPYNDVPASHAPSTSANTNISKRGIFCENKNHLYSAKFLFLPLSSPKFFCDCFEIAQRQNYFKYLRFLLFFFFALRKKHPGIKYFGKILAFARHATPLRPLCGGEHAPNVSVMGIGVRRMPGAGAGGGQEQQHP